MVDSDSEIFRLIDPMPSISELFGAKSRFRGPLVPGANYRELQYVWPSASWEDGLASALAAFPSEFRDGSAGWSAALKGTHWEGEVPPGDGPFYIPEWVWERHGLEKDLQKAGFVRVDAHVAYLTPDGEYLRAAMRIAGALPWNADPILYRAYLYPGWKPKKGRRQLRDYSTERWIGSVG